MKTYFPIWSSVLMVVSLSEASPSLGAVPISATWQPNLTAIETSQLNLPKQDRGSPNSTIGAGTRLYLPPPDDSHPRSTAGAGKRGTCLNRRERQFFMPIMFNDQGDTIFTTPSLWWYLPQNEGLKLEFSLFKQTGNEDALVYYQVINEVSQKSGLLEIRLPENILEAGSAYWWDLTLACDAADRSGDIYLWGSLERLNPQTLSLLRTPEVINSLQAQLSTNNTYLSVDRALATQLSIALTRNTENDFAWVEARLREHYLAQINQYEAINRSIQTLELQHINPDILTLEALKEERRVLIPELVQLSAYFQVWGDVTNLLTSYRELYPTEWQLLLEDIVPVTTETTDLNQADMIQQIYTAPNFSEH